MITDLNQDGNLDLIGGNHGLNSSLDATVENPVSLFANDFNKDGIIDPIITEIVQGSRYTVVRRDLLLRQLPHLKKKFPDYDSYSTATIYDILTTFKLWDADRFNANIFASVFFKNSGNGTFNIIPFPREVQIAPVYDMVVEDFNGDRMPDILAVGNNFGNRPKKGPMAEEGALLENNGSFEFNPQMSKQTELKL